ncbi:MAG: AAC(3) family N-acetyltransferase [Vicinamibacterales bacterium]
MSHGEREPARLFETQPWDFAFGTDSALDRFLRLDGKILLLGSDHDAVTFLHYVEHVADFPDKRIARYKVPMLEGTRTVWRESAEVDTSDGGAHAHWPDRFFARIVDTYLSETRNGGALVGEAQSWLLPARGLFDFARPLMEAVARDPRAADRLLALR